MRNSVWLSILALVPATAVAQSQQFVELGKAHLPRDGAVTNRAFLGDVDGDLDPDLLTSGDGNVRLYRQIDDGVFDGGQAVIPGGLAAVADLDLDGDLDVVTRGSDFSPSQLWLNDGSGRFSHAPGRLPGAGGAAIAVGDVDGDNDPDLAVSSFRQPTKLWLNNGSGTFSDAAANMPQAGFNNLSLAFADIDNDGDLDLFVGNGWYTIGHQFFPGPNELYLNNGSGLFADVSATDLPAVSPDNTFHVAIADVNGDGFRDIVMAETEGTRLFVNNGTGLFLDASGSLPAGSDRATGLALADLDRDNDLDLILPGTRNRIYINNGGQFIDASATWMPDELAPGTALAVALIDGDTDLDLVIGGEHHNQLLLNDRQSFVDATRPQAPPAVNGAMVLGDVDGDLDLDLVIGNSDQGARLLRNNGRGEFFTVTGAMPPDGEQVAHSLHLEDVDGDGDLDLLFVGFENLPWSMHPRLYVNNGSGAFSDATAGRVPRLDARTLEVGDVDNDGDPDLVLGVYQGRNRLLLNDGTGTFTDATVGRMPADADPTQAVLLFDANGDGNLDLALGQTDFSGTGRTRLYLGNGAGSFLDATAALMPNRADLVMDLAAGDIDGDGDRDLVLGCWGSTSLPAGRHRIYLNDGAGTFTDGTPGRLPDLLASTYDVELGDVDSDGDLDLFVSLYREHNVLWVNDGTGSFTAAPPSRFSFDTPAGSVRQFLLGDVDDDGDADLLLEGRVFVNLHRQVHAPLLASPGATYRLDYHSQPGYGSSAHLAQPFMSGSTLRFVLPPWGVFGLNPVGMLTLPAVSITRPDGRATRSFVIPNTATLLGQPFFVQAAIAVSPNLLDVRFTNVSPELVRSR